MNTELSRAIHELVRGAPAAWLEDACNELRTWPAGASANNLLHRLPATNNGNLSYQLRELVRLCDGLMSWEALGCAVSLCAALDLQRQSDQKVELLWAGPSPSGDLPARRIDQVLYDMIAGAREEILLVTFAAHKIKRLAEGLRLAVQRGVKVQLILEFGTHSQHQLTHDALKAFPDELQTQAKVYYWPLENRELNSYGKPGKLHAKVAVVDDQALLSSANLTDDAFLRNLELGTFFEGGEIPANLRLHFHHLINSGVLAHWKMA